MGGGASSGWPFRNHCVVAPFALLHPNHVAVARHKKQQSSALRLRASALVKVTVAFVGGIGLVLALTLVAFRSSWGRLFTDEDDIVDMVASLLPFLAMFVIGDSLGASSLANLLRSAGA